MGVGSGRDGQMGPLPAGTRALGTGSWQLDGDKWVINSSSFKA